MRIRPRIVQYAFQFCFEFGGQKVFDGVGVVMDMVGSDVEFFGKVKLPESVHLDDTPTAFFPCFGKSEQVAGLFEVTLVPQPAQYLAQVLALELASAHDFRDRALKVEVPAFLAELVEGLEYVLIVDRLAIPVLLDQPAYHAAPGCEEEGD